MNDKIVNKFLNLISPLMDRVFDIYLFGSRCRDDWKPDSDYDILIVLREKNRKTIDKLYEAVLEVLLSSGKLVSLKIFAESEFIRLKSIPTPFMHNVVTNGINLGKNK